MSPVTPAEAREALVRFMNSQVQDEHILLTAPFYGKGDDAILGRFIKESEARAATLEKERDEARKELARQKELAIGGHKALLKTVSHLRLALDVVEAAAALFSALYRADASDRRRIAVAPVPETGLGIAINDRLLRASHRD